MTFPWKLNDENAMKAAESWLGMLGPDVYAYVVYEEGAATGRGHLHLFVGGLINGGKVLKDNTKWIWRYKDHDFEIRSWDWAYWNKTIKVDHVDIYDHRGGAARYLSKYSFERPEHGRFIGKPKKPRRRKRGKRKKCDKWIAEMQDRKAKILQELGEAPGRDVSSEVDRQKQLAKTFDELTPQERVQMYRERPDEWQELIEAKQADGLRTLMRW
jgi:hypothetical protein